MSDARFSASTKPLANRRIDDLMLMPLSLAAWAIRWHKAFGISLGIVSALHQAGNSIHRPGEFD